MKEENRAGWTVDTLRELMQTEFEAGRRENSSQMTALMNMLQERYETQTKALDAAFAAAKEAVATALSSAKEATTKAEATADKRFESFRTETGMQIKAVADKFEDETTRIFDRIDVLTSRLDTAQGRDTGDVDTRNTTRLDNGQLLAIVSLGIAFVAVAARFITG